MERYHPVEMTKTGGQTKIVDLAAMPFTLQKIYENFGFSPFTSSELAEVLGCSREEWNRRIIQFRLQKLRGMRMLNVERNPNYKRIPKNAGYWLSDRARTYLNRWKSFTNESGPLMSYYVYKKEKYGERK